MRKIFLFIVIVFFSSPFCSFFIFADISDADIGEGDKLAYSLNRQFSGKMKKQYGLVPFAHHLGGGKIELIGMSLYTTQLLNKKEARIYIIDCIEKYLEEISTAQALQKHFCESFSTENIELNIFIYDKKGDPDKLGNLGMVGIKSGIIRFIVFDPIYFEENEPYEEALKIVLEERKALLEASHDFFQCIQKNKIN